MDVVTAILEEVFQIVAEGIFPPPPIGDDDGYNTESDATLPFEWEGLPFDWEDDRLWE